MHQYGQSPAHLNQVGALPFHETWGCLARSSRLEKVHNTDDPFMVIARGASPNLLQHTECCCATQQRLQALQLSFECNSMGLVQQFQPRAILLSQ